MANFSASSPSSSPSAVAGGGDSAGATATTTPSPLPLPASNPPSSSSRRLPPPCWTNEETLALIDSYREKWFSLRRGNLRAAHWDEVAAAVARRCHEIPGATTKTSVQCRHKVEKLRKRYRSEKQRSLSHDPSAPPSSSWIFFRKMDSMERGGGTTVADRHDSGDDDEDDGGDRIGGFHRPMDNGIEGLRFKIPKAIRSKIVGSRPIPTPNLNTNTNSTGRVFRGFGGVKPGMEEMRRRLEEKKRREEEGKEDAMGEMVGVLRMLGDGYMRMEQMKMDMAREMERVRMEMELKRTEMILDTQRRIVDSFIKGAVGKKKKAKISLDS